MDTKNSDNINLKKPLKPYRQSQLDKRKSNHKPRYNNNQILQFHSLLERKHVPKAYLTTMLNVSTPPTALRLINQPLKLNLQQLFNIAYLLDINLHDLIDVIVNDLYNTNCASSSNEHIKPFVNEDVKILHNSSEWFNR